MKCRSSRAVPCSLLLVALPLLAAADVRTVVDATRFTDRVIPLPKEVTIPHSVVLPASKVALAPVDVESHVTSTAVGRIAKFARCQDRRPGLTIVLGTIATVGKHLPSELVKRLGAVKNRDQAYVIHSKPEQGRLILAGYGPVGMLYAAQTLGDMVGEADAKGQVEVPFAEVFDWPDMASRGIWGRTALDLMSACKMNLLSLNSNPAFDTETGEPITTFDVEILRNCAENGIQNVIYISHVGRKATYRARGEGLPLLSNPKAMVRYAAAVAPEPGFTVGKRRGLCFSSPATDEILSKWLLSIASRTYQYHHDLEIWFSESIRRCHCAECRDREPHLLELDCFKRIFPKVRKQYPDARFRVLLTQGTAKTGNNPEILSELPEYAVPVYYHGQETYKTHYRPMVPGYIEAYGKTGRAVGIVLILTVDTRVQVPFVSPQYPQLRLGELVRKGLSSFAMFISLTPYHYELNFLAAGEYGWNNTGRTPREFARAYATRKGIGPPERFAEWAEKLGKANLDLAEDNTCNLQLFLGSFHKTLTRRQFDNYFRRLRMYAPAVLEADVRVAEEAMGIAQELGEPGMVAVNRYVLGMLRLFRALRQVVDFLDKPSDDQQARERIARGADDLDEAAWQARQGIIDWEVHTAAATSHDRPEKDGIPFLFGAMSRSANVLLATCDAARLELGKRGILDPRPDSRRQEIGRWAGSDFAEGKAAQRFDITDRIKPNSQYRIAFSATRGCSVAARWRVSVERDGKRVTSWLSPQFRAQPKQRNRTIERDVEIPAHEPRDRIVLTVTLDLYPPEIRSLFPDQMPTELKCCDGIIYVRRLEASRRLTGQP